MSLVFPTLTVAKSLATEGISGCQMKDMDLIFPLIPYDGVLYLASGATVSSCLTKVAATVVSYQSAALYGGISEEVSFLSLHESQHKWRIDWKSCTPYLSCLISGTKYLQMSSRTT